MPDVIIDAGHGGSEPVGKSTPFGSTGPDGVAEKRFNLELSREVVRRLGGHAALTRVADRNLSLAERAGMVSSQGASVFVSLHGRSSGPRRPETWIHADATAASRELAGHIQGALGRQSSGGSDIGAGDLAVLHPSLYGSGVAACMVEVDQPHLSARPGNGGGSVAGVEPVAEAIANGIRAYVATRGKGNVAAGLRVVQPDYIPTDPVAAVRMWSDFLTRHVRWTVGVTDTTVYPHSSICYIRSGGTTSYIVGTAFYIAPNRLLTAAHCVDGQSSLTVVPGFNGPAATSRPFGDFNVASSAWKIYPGYSGNGDWDRDMAIIRVDVPPPAGTFFEPVELDRSVPDEPIIVCGYSAIEPLPNLKQHLDADMIRWLSDSYEHFGYNLQTLGGASGSPVFYFDNHSTQQCSPDNLKVAGVHVGGASPQRPTLNIGCRISAAKLSWIHQNTQNW